jgi:hypothetical protein
MNIFKSTLVISLAVVAACSLEDQPLAPEAPPPTYDELFERYFAAGTAGHCATAGCHVDPGHHIWLCADADSCYDGMRDMGLIDPYDPAQSEIADPARSPLTWVNPTTGSMPLGARGQDASARAAVQAWVRAGATK